MSPTATRSYSNAVLQQRGLTATRSYSNAVCELTHVLSHQRIHARFIVHKVQKMPEIPGTLLIHWEELNDFALSRLTLRALDILLPSLPR